MFEFTIIVPVYNEELNLKRVEKELLSFIKISKKETTILFINDGSTDNSQQIIEDICQKNIEFRFIHFKKNKGLSAALKAGFDDVDTPLLGYIDADLQTSPKDFNILLNHTEHYDLVTGMRTQRKDSLIKKISSTLNCGILLISHDLHFVMSATDHVVCLNGHICCSGTPSSVVKDSAYIELFGEHRSKTLAYYQHDHDHSHETDGSVVN